MNQCWSKMTAFSQSPPLSHLTSHFVIQRSLSLSLSFICSFCLLFLFLPFAPLSCQLSSSTFLPSFPHSSPPSFVPLSSSFFLPLALPPPSLPLSIFFKPLLLLSLTLPRASVYFFCLSSIFLLAPLFLQWDTVHATSFLRSSHIVALKTKLYPKGKKSVKNKK